MEQDKQGVQSAGLQRSHEAASELEPWRCVTCGSNATQRHCSSCGEQKPGSRNFSLIHLIGHSFETVFHFDSKIFRTLATLFRRPGKLTSEFFVGRRKPYLSPFQLFLVTNIFFFLIEPLIRLRILAVPLTFQITEMPYARIAKILTMRRLAALPASLAEFAPRFDHLVTLHSKSLVIVMVPLFALALLGFYWGSRRFFVEHLVFSLHFYTFWLLWTIAVLALMAFLGMLFGWGKSGSSQIPVDTAATAIEFFAFGTYLYLAAREFYKQGRGLTLAKAAALSAISFGVLHVYRFIVFLTTLYSA